MKIDVVVILKNQIRLTTRERKANKQASKKASKQANTLVFSSCLTFMLFVQIQINFLILIKPLSLVNKILVKMFTEIWNIMYIKYF